MSSEYEASSAASASALRSSYRYTTLKGNVPPLPAVSMRGTLGPPGGA